MNPSKNLENAQAFWLWRRQRVLAIVASSEIVLSRRKKKSTWVKTIFKKRREQGAYYNLIQEMRLTDTTKYFNYLRMMPSEFDFILSVIGPSLNRQHLVREPICAAQQLAVTLRYLASGDSMVSISYAFRLGKTTITHIVARTCKVIWEKLHHKVILPMNEQNWRSIANDYFNIWNIPNCVGSIDGKHVIMQAPPNSGSEFYNYKGDFSLVLLALCDANYCFTYVDIGAKGRQSDGGVFRNSSLGKALINNTLDLPADKCLIEGQRKMPFYIVGDAAFPLCTYLMRPYPGRLLPQDERVFNYRLSRARRVIENAFGILAQKWRVLRKPIIAKLETVERIVQATICLHNFLRQRDVLQSDENRYISGIDREDETGSIVNGEWRNEPINNCLPAKLGGNAYSRDAANIRNELKNYFMYEMPIEPQWYK